MQFNLWSFLYKLLNALHVFEARSAAMVLHACVCLLFTLHSSVFLQTIINIQGHAQSPEAFSRWCESANSLCYLTGKYIAGMSPPPLGSPSTENVVRETSASERAIITGGSPGKCDGDTPACMCCMWRSAMQKWLSAPLTSSLLPGVASGTCPWCKSEQPGTTVACSK